MRTWKEWREISGGDRETKKPKWLGLTRGKCANQNQMEEWASQPTSLQSSNVSKAGVTNHDQSKLFDC